MHKNFHWTCPYCNRDSVITDTNYSKDTHFFNQNNKYGTIAFTSEIIVCPNSKCREYALSTSLAKAKKEGYTHVILENEPLIASYKLKPNSNAKIYPEYIPQPIRNDYIEACLIVNLSPKASATLTRRALQGMIRDHWKIQKKRLIDEINDLKDKVEPTIWKAIDSVRTIGNIGAHMEKDVNEIIDVDINESELLIKLLEYLIEQWYIVNYERNKQMEELISVADQKNISRKGLGLNKI